MSLRACKGEAIQHLPIYKGRKWVEYKSPECPVWGTEMNAASFINLIRALKYTLPAAKFKTIKLIIS